MGSRRAPQLPPMRTLDGGAADTNGTIGTAVHCRICWRGIDAHTALRLPCGDVFCRVCLAEMVRATLASPLAVLPIRCCWMPIPATVLRQVLAPPELAFYAFRTQQRVDTIRNRVVNDHVELTTPCDFCLVPTRITTPQHVNEQLLSCGHVYCPECVATLKQSTDRDDRRPLCCPELMPTVTPAMPTLPPIMPRDTQPQRRDLPVDVPTFQGKGKGKRKFQAAQADPNVVDLLDDSDDEDTEYTNGHQHNHDMEEEPKVCIKCHHAVNAATNRFRAACGHVFCRTCLHLRCLRALKNEEQGSIGIPVSCCQALVSLELLRAVLSKRNFIKYEALVAKRGEAAIPVAIRTTCKRKAATTTETTPSKRTKTTTAKDEEDEAPAECVACMTDVENPKGRFKGPCGHVYCFTCLGMMAKQSLEDRALVPIRCCAQEFPIDYVQLVLNRTQFAQYDRFLKEKDWRTSDLRSDKEYAAIVKAINGKQCPTCGVGVQKISGCDAIRCLRGHLFCFACESAPCTCGRTRLESYGWVPPGTVPPPRGAVRGVPILFGGVGLDPNRFEAAAAAVNARAAGLLAQAMVRVRAAAAGPADPGAAVARAHPKTTRRR